MDNAENITTIHLGADHAGFKLKEVVQQHLELSGYEVVDHGAFEEDSEDDYPDFIAPVAREVSIDPQSRGIILGGSGQGEAIVANRFPNVRAAVYYGSPEKTQIDAQGNEFSILVSSRQHNNSNILSLGARFLTEEEAIEAVDLWLETAFSGEERHVRRIEKIEELGN